MRALLALGACVALCACANSIAVPDPVTGGPWLKCHSGFFEPSVCTAETVKDREVTVSGAGAFATFNSAAGVTSEAVTIGTLLAK